MDADRRSAMILSQAKAFRFIPAGVERLALLLGKKIQFAKAVSLQTGNYQGFIRFG
jgi:hypothetical protein